MNELKLKPIARVNLRNKSWKKSSREVYVRLNSKNKGEGVQYGIWRNSISEGWDAVLVSKGSQFRRGRGKGFQSPGEFPVFF